MRKRNCIFICSFVSLFLACSIASGQRTEPDTSRFRLGTIFRNFGDNTRESFLSENALFHLGGAAASWYLVRSGADFRIHRYFNEQHAASVPFYPVLFTGALIPFATGIPLYYVGQTNRDRELFGAGCAVFQAGLITALYTSAVKVFTGRPRPPDAADHLAEESSRDFHSGFWRVGIIQGWPSGHAAATTATIASLISYYPDMQWLKISGYAFITYTLIGVAAARDGTMHWFSDGVAGTLSGYAIGSTIGKNFRDALFPDLKGDHRSDSIRIIPDLGFGYTGFMVLIQF